MRLKRYALGVGAAARSFGRDTRSTVAIVAALAGTLFLGFSVLAVDVGIIEFKRQNLQRALDSALLSAAAGAPVVSSESDREAVETIVRNHVSKTLSSVSPDDLSISVSASSDRASGSTRLAAQATQRTEWFSALMLRGESALDIRVTSALTRPDVGKLELVLVLDTTGSMSGSKLTALKRSATELIDAIVTEDGPVRVAIVPFDVYVNVGSSVRAPWLEQEFRPPGSPTRTWGGCVGSRDYPLNVRDTEPTDATRYPAIVGVSCSTTITPLTSNPTTLRAAIDRLSARGNTYIPAGLVWGFAALSSHEPYTQGAPYSDRSVSKAMVLMTDGANSASVSARRPWPGLPAHAGRDLAQANSFTSELCSNIKSAGISLYTIAFDIADTSTVTMLRQCASDQSDAFSADTSDELTAAFRAIRESLRQLALVQ